MGDYGVILGRYQKIVVWDDSQRILGKHLCGTPDADIKEKGYFLREQRFESFFPSKRGEIPDDLIKNIKGLEKVVLYEGREEVLFPEKGAIIEYLRLSKHQKAVLMKKALMASRK
ncbi:MAG: hypothetical protein Q7J54_07945 [Candidatus Woesearchaeota archaeon]|nr:hypothetical protein [Candidatus Woesearchaeota archaeon]